MKTKIVYECFDYIIEQIPLNYKATIKCARKDKSKTIDREVYCHLEESIDNFKEIIEDQIKLYFISGKANTTPQFR